MEYTDEQINQIANDFFKNNRFEKAKIAGFKAGFKKALSLFAVSGQVCEHYYRYLETTEKGMQCKKCMTLLNEQTLR